jgi:hypothetical protein
VVPVVKYFRMCSLSMIFKVFNKKFANITIILKNRKFEDIYYFNVFIRVIFAFYEEKVLELSTVAYTTPKSPNHI